MPSQVTRSIRSVLVSILLVSDIAVGTTARADDCVVEPTHDAPKNSEWRYRTDRTKHRKCWFLRAAPGSPTADPVQPRPTANSTAHQAGGGLSEKEQQKLFTQFQEWRRRNDN
jgi:hypothetical protein